MALTILGTKLDPFYDNFIRAYKTDYLSLCLARALGANDFGLVWIKLTYTNTNIEYYQENTRRQSCRSQRVNHSVVEIEF